MGDIIDSVYSYNIRPRPSRARAVGRPLAKRIAVKALQEAAKFTRAAARKARQYGAKSTLSRKMGAGFRDAATSTEAALANLTLSSGGVRKRRGLPMRGRRVGGMRVMKRKPQYKRSNISGAYTGKDNLVWKSPKASKSLVFEKYGAVHENETSGTNTMLHCNWIGFQNARPFELGRVIGMALVRYIYRKYYGVDFGDTGDSLLQASTIVNAGNQPNEIIFHWEQSAGTTTTTGTAVFTISDIESVATFGTWFSNNVFLSSNFGQFSPTRYLKRITISEVSPVSSGTSGFYRTKTLYADKILLSCYSYANIQLQNSTVSDGGSTSTDVIDANPLVGKVYKFNGLCPIQSQITRRPAGSGTPNVIWDDLNTTTTNGLVLPATDPPQAYRVPASPSMFEALKGYASVKFEPGETKTYNMKFTFKGYLNTLLQNINPSGGTGTPQTVVYATRFRRAMGECLLFALEKRIKGESAVPLIVNYHVDHYAGCKIDGVANTIMNKEVVTVEQDNDPV